MSGIKKKVEAYKGIVLLKRREGMSREELLDWLLNSHSRYSRSVPEVLRYTGSLVVAPGPRYEFPNGEPPFDLINEIWCRDREALEKAYVQLGAMGGPEHTLAAVSQRIPLFCEEYVLK
ncbi:MAG: EthD domain-containing protein [Betaproteobacteria bacterium]|nr:EthD domain-containing protein [Betaproteobacteria bacterium]